MRKSANAPSFIVDIARFDVIKLENVLFALDLRHLALDVCLEVEAEPLREEVCKPHGTTFEESLRGGPIRPPLITLNLLTCSRNRLQITMADENTDAAERIKSHGAGDLFHRDDGGDWLSLNELAYLLRLLGVVGIVMGSNVEEHRHQRVVDLVGGGAVLEGQVQMLGGRGEGSTDVVREAHRISCLIMVSLPSVGARAKVIAAPVAVAKSGRQRASAERGPLRASRVPSHSHIF